jgi:hypothetical protein
MREKSIGFAIGRWCLRCLTLGAHGQSGGLGGPAVQDRSIRFGRGPGIGHMLGTGPIWLAVRGCATSPCGPLRPLASSRARWPRMVTSRCPIEFGAPICRMGPEGFGVGAVASQTRRDHDNV